MHALAAMVAHVGEPVRSLRTASRLRAARGVS